MPVSAYGAAFRARLDNSNRREFGADAGLVIGVVSKFNSPRSNSLGFGTPDRYTLHR